jgi:hypothetical protein
MHIRLKSILEGRFRNRKNQIHLFDAPMFSVYADINLPKKDMYNIKRGKKRIKSAFENARQQIHSMGFASMHSNVLIKDLSGETNINTSRMGGVVGYAHSKGKYMELSSKMFDSGSTESLTKTIVHEWAHLWMFNNSKEFKNSVNTLYNKLVSSGAEKIKPEDIESHIMKKFNHTDELSLIKKWSGVLDSAMWIISTDKEFVKNASREELLQRIESNILTEFNEICNDFRFNPTEEIISTVKSMIENYIAPKAIEVLRNEDLLNKLLGDGEMYDFLWVRNELKPDSVSITKKFKQLYLAREFPKTKKDMLAPNQEFRGADNSFHRNYLKNIHNWVNDYGMSNNHEMWATGIEEFFKLPPPHRKAIIKLMMNMGAG